MPQLKIGDKVRAIFRKSEDNEIIGTVTEVSHNKYCLTGWWVSIKVHEFVNKKSLMAKLTTDLVNQGHYNILCPLRDVKEIIQ